MNVAEEKDVGNLFMVRYDADRVSSTIWFIDSHVRSKGAFH